MLDEALSCVCMVAAMVFLLLAPAVEAPPPMRHFGTKFHFQMKSLTANNDVLK